MEFCILDTVTTNCDNFGRLFGARRKTPRRQSRPLLVAWTTATRCATAVQNAAARFVMGTRRCDHISPVLCQLHWLPVRQRVVFKIATLAHQSLSGNAPGYLADDCQLVADACVRQLRSADTRTLVVSRTRSSFGYGTFAAAGLRVWNSLPPNLLLCGLSYGQFRRLLKSFCSDSEATAQCEFF